MTYRVLARKAGYSASALSAAASGDTLPTLDLLLAYVGACGADREGRESWERRWHDLAATERPAQSGPPAQSDPPACSEGQLPGDEAIPVAPDARAAAPREADATLGDWGSTLSYGCDAPGGAEHTLSHGEDAQVGAEAVAPFLPQPGPLSRRTQRRRLVLPVRLGLAPIILAAAAITAYAILLPAPPNSPLIVTPHPTGRIVPPIVTTPVHKHKVTRPLRHTAPTASASPARNPTQTASGNPAPGAGSGTATGTPPATSQPGRVSNPPAGLPLTQLGAPNWNGYCEVTGHGAVQLTSNDAYGWHCADGAGTDGTAACAWTFGYSTSQVTSRIQDFYDPNSWQCWRVTRKLGAPDFNGYCQATGQGPVRLVSTNAYGWRCSADNGTGDDANAVCAWTFGYSTSQVTNRFQNFYDPYSWQCWA